MEINVSLVQKLISKQFPQWEKLLIEPVKQSGWDNRTFHLGKNMTIRLPSNGEYAPQILKEFYWLPILAKKITTTITTPMALGKPCEDYPFHWAINRWIDGETVSSQSIQDINQFAQDLAGFLIEFQTIDSSEGPVAGSHNFYRGGDISVYHDEMCKAMAKMENSNQQKIAKQLWTDALSSKWEKQPVWVHGDFAVGNLLVHSGKLKAVIDFGQLAIGDPACDLAITWNFFTGDNRKMFQSALDLDRDTWVRTLGWTLWKTVCWPIKGTEVRRIIQNVLEDYKTQYLYY